MLRGGDRGVGVPGPAEVGGSFSCPVVPTGGSLSARTRCHAGTANRERPPQDGCPHTVPVLPTPFFFQLCFPCPPPAV